MSLGGINWDITELVRSSPDYHSLYKHMKKNGKEYEEVERYRNTQGRLSL
jgi:hypothetical protein